MSIRTDLVLEQRELHTERLSGVKSHDTQFGDVILRRVEIRDDTAAQALEKPIGRYITIEFGDLTTMTDTENLEQAVAAALEELLPADREGILAVGLGNADITPDAIGPLTVGRLLATRHIDAGLAGSLGLDGLRSVSTLIPGVLGKTGIEAAEIIRGTVERTRPTALLVIDALAARRSERLCRTVQMTDTGICPGSGVGNARRAINREVLGVPVIAIGIPTVVDAASLVYDLTGREPEEAAARSMMVTPKDIDQLTLRAAELLGRAINTFLQPTLDIKTIQSLV